MKVTKLYCDHCGNALDEMHDYDLGELEEKHTEEKSDGGY